MQSKKQLNISVNLVTVEQEVWFADIIADPCILGLDALEQLSATIDTGSCHTSVCAVWHVPERPGSLCALRSCVYWVFLSYTEACLPWV